MKVSEDLENIVTEYKKLNDQTYITVSEQIERNSKKLVELDNKIKVEWRNTVKSFTKSEGSPCHNLNLIWSCKLKKVTAWF